MAGTGVRAVVCSSGLVHRTKRQILGPALVAGTNKEQDLSQATHGPIMPFQTSLSTDLLTIAAVSDSGPLTLASDDYAYFLGN
jgi:hypothetical protein